MKILLAGLLIKLCRVVELSLLFWIHRDLLCASPQKLSIQKQSKLTLVCQLCQESWLILVPMGTSLGRKIATLERHLEYSEILITHLKMTTQRYLVPFLNGISEVFKFFFNCRKKNKREGGGNTREVYKRKQSIYSQNSELPNDNRLVPRCITSGWEF